MWTKHGFLGSNKCLTHLFKKSSYNNLSLDHQIMTNQGFLILLSSQFQIDELSNKSIRPRCLLCNLTPSKEVGPWGVLVSRTPCHEGISWTKELQELIFHFIMWYQVGVTQNKIEQKRMGISINKMLTFLTLPPNTLEKIS